MAASNRRGARDLLAVVVLLCSLLVCGAEAVLEIGSSSTLSHAEAALEEDVVIRCVVTDEERSRVDLDLSVVSVEWHLESANGSRWLVHRSIRQSQRSYRSGSTMDMEQLRRGIASLTLTKVQIGDEGEYTCSIIVTPDRMTARITLRVLARPMVTLIPHNLTIERGHERSVICEVTRFYPKSIAIRWFKSHKGSTLSSALDKETCNSVPVENHDGTFNVTSLVLLKASGTEEDGDLYSCTVSHTSYKGDRAFYFTLLVKEPDASSNLDVILPITVLLALALVVPIILVCVRKAPSLSNITGAAHLVHEKKSTLTCMISGYKPNTFKIKLYAKRDGDAIRQRVCFQKYPFSVEQIENPSMNENILEQHYTEDCGTDTLKAELKLSKPNRTLLYYHCLCVIHVTPDIERDEGAELTLEVEHPALRSPKSESCKLKINGDLLRLDPIEAPQNMIHGQPVTLTCRMMKYNPGPLQICWLKEDSMKHNLTETIFEEGQIFERDRYSHTLSPDEQRGRVYVTSSSLSFSADKREDDGKKYTCRVSYRALSQTEQSTLDMSVVALPLVEPVASNPAEPSDGQSSPAEFAPSTHES